MLSAKDFLTRSVIFFALTGCSTVPESENSRNDIAKAEQMG